MAIVDGKIRCACCREFKSLDNYPPSAVKDKNGTCKSCAAERAAIARANNPAKANIAFRKWYEKNKEVHLERIKDWEQRNAERIHDRHLQRTYGISLLEYNSIIKEQGGGCGICGAKQEDSRMRLAVDHCHETQKVRGVLCHSCNRAIGVLGDNIEGVMRVLDYLRKEKSWQTNSVEVV